MSEIKRKAMIRECFLSWKCANHKSPHMTHHFHRKFHKLCKGTPPIVLGFITLPPIIISITLSLISQILCFVMPINSRLKQAFSSMQKSYFQDRCSNLQQGGIQHNFRFYGLTWGRLEAHRGLGRRLIWSPSPPGGSDSEDSAGDLAW